MLIACKYEESIDFIPRITDILRAFPNVQITEFEFRSFEMDVLKGYYFLHTFIVVYRGSLTVSRVPSSTLLFLPTLQSNPICNLN